MLTFIFIFNPNEFFSQFITYGWEFTVGSNFKVADRVFPKMSKCEIYLFGPSGTRQRYDSLCVLPLNVLYDKMFLVLWFWYIFLLAFSVTSVLYWSWHIIMPNYRLSHIERHLKGRVKGNQLKFLNKHFGDWFLLHQLYKNIHHSNFTQLVSTLAAVEENKSSILKKTETFISFNLTEDDEENKLRTD